MVVGTALQPEESVGAKAWAEESMADVRKGEVICVGSHSWLEVGSEEQQRLECEELVERYGLPGASLRISSAFRSLLFSLAMLQTEAQRRRGCYSQTRG